IRSELGAAIGQMRMDDLVSTDTIAGTGKTRVDQSVEDLHQRLLGTLKRPLRDDYGIELVDIRLRRFSHPAQVRDSIFERIRSERDRKAAQYRSQGKEKASNIESEAEETVRRLLAEARRMERILKGEADTAADRLRNQAH